MGTLIRFDIKKIVQNRAGVAACAIALILVMALSLGSVLTAGAWDARSGSYVEGLGAWDAIRRTEQSHAGTLDDARVAEDMATYEEAQARWAQDADHLGSLSAQQMIDQYGIEFWREVDRVRSDAYYLRLKTAMLLDDKGTHAPGLQEGAGNFLSNELSGRYLGFFPYAESERSFWEGKASRIEWPIEYGSALAWGEILSFMAFYAFVTIAACIAVSGVFAGEYQGGTASIALPTLRGKRSLPVAKVVASMLFASAYWWASVAVGSGVFLVALGADGAGLPYQIFDFVNPYPMTVGQVCASLFLLGWVVTLGCVAFTLLLSSRLRSVMPVAVTPLAVTFLGVFAKLIVPLSKVAHLTPMNVLNDSFVALASYALGPVVFDLPSAAALLYALLALVCAPLAVRSFVRYQVA